MWAKDTDAPTLQVTVMTFMVNYFNHFKFEIMRYFVITESMWYSLLCEKSVIVHQNGHSCKNP